MTLVKNDCVNYRVNDFCLGTTRSTGSASDNWRSGRGGPDELAHQSMQRLSSQPGTGRSAGFATDRRDTKRKRIDSNSAATDSPTTKPPQMNIGSSMSFTAAR